MLVEVLYHPPYSTKAHRDIKSLHSVSKYFGSTKTIYKETQQWVVQIFIEPAPM